MFKYSPVIGLEIHIQAKTKSKMFCSCSTDYFGDKPNTHVCPVCLGLPGALPVPNKAAIEQCIRLGLALNCEINEFSKFDRKNYFYPDLPKAYQISQYDYPVAKNGYLLINTKEGESKIRIRRVHQEEDTGKSIHEGGTTFLDFNKSGMPLMEVVTEPDFKTLEEVTAFAKLLKQTVEYIGVSDAEMQKGQMRFELNISLRQEKDGENLPPYRVEVKNIGSISALEKVMQFEIARQTQMIDAGQELKNETRGLKDMSGETVSQRSKENENDYRYFPEPDIPPFINSKEMVESLRAALPELPAARLNRYLAWGLNSEQADTLVDQPLKGDWVDSLAKDISGKSDLNADLSSDAETIKSAAKLLIGDISYQLEQQNLQLSDSTISMQDVIFLVRKQKEGSLTSTIVKQVIEQVFTTKRSAEQVVKEDGLEVVQDSSQLEAWVEKAIAENPQFVESLAKNPNAYKALIGVVMRESKGQANPVQVEEMVKGKLGI